FFTKRPSALSTLTDQNPSTGTSLAVERVGVEQAFLQRGDRERPERIDRRQFPRREADRVARLRAVHLLAFGVHEVERVEPLLLGVAVDADLGRHHPVEVVVLQRLAAADHVLGAALPSLISFLVSARWHFRLPTTFRPELAAALLPSGTTGS